jgi:hypothetical protein
MARKFGGFRDLGPYHPFGALWLEKNGDDKDKVKQIFEPESIPFEGCLACSKVVGI